MRGAVVAQQPASVAPGEVATLGLRGKAGGAVAVAGAGEEGSDAEVLGPDREDERPARQVVCPLKSGPP